MEQSATMNLSLVLIIQFLIPRKETKYYLVITPYSLSIKVLSNFFYYSPESLNDTNCYHHVEGDTPWHWLLAFLKDSSHCTPDAKHAVFPAKSNKKALKDLNLTWWVLKNIQRLMCEVPLEASPWDIGDPTAASRNKLTSGPLDADHGKKNTGQHFTPKSS